MDLRHYFEKTEGIGVLATSDLRGQLNQAVYSKPFVIDDKTVAFIMKQRHSHKNLQHHLQASYLFIEKGTDIKGIRFHLTMLSEDKNCSLIEALREKQPSIYPEDDDSNKFLVFFDVDQIRPLIGDAPDD
jgi:hypothetical protein